MASNDFLSMAGAEIEYSLDCSQPVPTWTSFCAETADISVSGGDRNVAERSLFCDTGTVTVLGEKNAFNITVDVLYSEEAGSPAWNAIWVAFETLDASCDFGIRWSPKGGNVGDDRFTACGVLLDFPPPFGSAAGDAVITTTLVMQAPAVTRDTI